jgi:predicted MFS family arabinose efflux permease
LDDVLKSPVKNIDTHRKRGNLLALTIVAIMLGVMFVGAIMPTPLYPLFRAAFGFSGVTLTLIYAVYVLGNLAALLLFGRLADQIGRRAVSVPAIGVGIASALAFAFAASTPWLFVARALSGFSTGLAAGAATAWIAELYPDRGSGTASRIAAAANFFGCAVGPLMGGVLAQFALEPLRLPFLVYLVLLCATAGAIFLAPETVAERKSLAEASLKPRLGVPQSIRLQFIAPAVAAFAAFALIGFYAALVPGLLRDSLHLSAPLIAGAIVGELFFIAAVTILSTGRLESRTAMLGSLVMLLPSLWLLIVAQIFQSLPVLLLAAAGTGVSGGLGYRGSLEVINRMAPPDQRSEVVSSYLVVCFAGNSLPVIGIGMLAAATSQLVADVSFAVVITALAGLAFLTDIKYAPSR